MKRLNKPLVTQETIKAMEDMSFFTHAMIFDDLLIIAQRETSCFVLWTTDGLIIIDAIWPASPAFDAIVNAVVSGKADFGAAGMTVTDERKLSVDFTDTYATASQVIIVTK